MLSSSPVAPDKGSSNSKFPPKASRNLLILAINAANINQVSLCFYRIDQHSSNRTELRCMFIDSRPHFADAPRIIFWFPAINNLHSAFKGGNVPPGQHITMWQHNFSTWSAIPSVWDNSTFAQMWRELFVPYSVSHSPSSSSLSSVLNLQESK